MYTQSEISPGGVTPLSYSATCYVENNYVIYSIVEVSNIAKSNDVSSLESFYFLVVFESLKLFKAVLCLFQWKNLWYKDHNLGIKYLLVINHLQTGYSFSLYLHSHNQEYTIHCSKPWSHAVVTLLYPLLFHVPPVKVLFFIQVALLWTPGILLPPLPSSGLYASLTLSAIYFRPPALHNYTLPEVHATHWYELKSIIIAVQHLSDWPYTCIGAHTNTNTINNLGTCTHIHSTCIWEINQM